MANHIVMARTSVRLFIQELGMNRTTVKTEADRLTGSGKVEKNER
jgi:hypothetical protein